MQVIIRDDKKGKHQSVSATFDVDTIQPMSHAQAIVTGYGSTELEARAALNAALQDLQAYLNSGKSTFI